MSSPDRRRALWVALPVLATVAMLPLGLAVGGQPGAGVLSVLEMGSTTTAAARHPIPGLPGGGSRAGPQATITARSRRAWSPTWSPTRHDQQTYGSTW